MLQILLVEDNEAITDALSYTLQKEGFTVDVCKTERAALERVYKQVYDLAILDVALPDGTGLEICRQLKAARPDTAIIFLTAKDEEKDVVAGLDLGADDYVVKPFRARELVSRINSVLRRYNKRTKEIVVGDLRLDLVAGRLFRMDKEDKAGAARLEREIVLTALEMRIVALLFQNRGITLTREKILDDIWDYSGDVVNDNTLTVYVKRVREKLGEQVVKTVRGVGYRVE